MSACPACGNRRPADAHFCPVCGVPVDRSLEEPTARVFVLESGGEGAVEGAGALSRPRDGRGVLVIMRGPGAGSRFTLVSDAVTIGRHPASDVILNDVSVSRRHARVHLASGRYRIRDLGSLNGTYLNGGRVEEAALAHGDELQIGLYKLAFLVP